MQDFESASYATKFLMQQNADSESPSSHAMLDSLQPKLLLMFCFLIFVIFKILFVTPLLKLKRYAKPVTPGILFRFLFMFLSASHSGPGRTSTTIEEEKRYIQIQFQYRQRLSNSKCSMLNARHPLRSSTSIVLSHQPDTLPLNRFGSSV